MPGLRRIARILLAAVLLAAQQAAFGHAIWHAGTAQAAAGSPQKSDAGRKPLCDQHAGLGAVLGAIGCAPALAACPAPEIAAVAVLVLPARGNAPLTPSSRDPPAFL